MDKLPQAILFIHGKGKKSETWNTTESGKIIDIEKSLSKNVHTMLLQVDDFTIIPSKLIDQIIDDMRFYRWIIITHSLGVVHAFELLGRQIMIDGLCFIDPTAFTGRYIDSIKQFEIAEWIKEQLIIEVTPRIVFHIHINYQSGREEDLFQEKIIEYSKFTHKNDKSRVIVHYNKSHMIHYTDAPKIIDSLKDLLMRTK